MSLFPVPYAKTYTFIPLEGFFHAKFNPLQVTDFTFNDWPLLGLCTEFCSRISFISNRSATGWRWVVNKVVNMGGGSIGGGKVDSKVVAVDKVVVGGCGQGSQAGGSGVVVDPQGVLRVLAMSDSNLSKIRHRSSIEQLPKNLRRPSKLRKVALGRLETALAATLESDGVLSDEIINLAGLTQIRYVFVYPATSDSRGEIVLAGPAEPWVEDSFGRAIGIESETPIVQLEDLAAAIRVFPPGQPADQLVGCSIDPTKEGLARMQSYLKRVGTVNPTRD